jgi:hypothetical protein
MLPMTININPNVVHGLKFLQKLKDKNTREIKHRIHVCSLCQIWKTSPYGAQVKNIIIKKTNFTKSTDGLKIYIV